MENLATPEQVLKAERNLRRESLPALRLTKQVPPTQLEIKVLREAVVNFGDAAESFGLGWSDNEAELSGPALAARPIAIFR